MTKTMIESNRRKEIKSIVIAVLKHYGKYSLPVNIKKIAKSFDFIRVIPFSVQMKHRNMSLDEVIAYCETDDACADYYYDKNKAIIYYNDMIKWKFINSNRYRWSIAHELGHIMLGHHVATRKTRIFRSSLSGAEYDYLEEEADYFAQLILVPHSPLLGFNIQTSNHIQILCKISGPASRKRFYEFTEWKRHVDGNDEYDKRIFYFYFDFVFKRECKNCGVGLIQRYGKYCPICGSKNTLQWGDGDKMKYPLLETYENGKLKECPICKNEDTNIEGSYCQICSTKLINMCTNQSCNNYDILPTNARYCPVCGKESTFYTSRIIKAWDYKEPNIFMAFPDDIDDELPFN